MDIDFQDIIQRSVRDRQKFDVALCFLEKLASLGTAAASCQVFGFWGGAPKHPHLCTLGEMCKAKKYHWVQGCTPIPLYPIRYPTILAHH